MKRHGIFIKIFAYTMISTALLVSMMAVLFSQQFFLFYRTMQSRQIIASYEPLIDCIQRRENKHIAEVARLYYESNQSFEFNVIDKDGNSIYSTPNADTSNNVDRDFYFVVHRDIDFTIIAQSKTGLESFYSDLFIRAAVVIVVMFTLCLICSFIFARQMTRPIKQLAYAASKMARLEDVPQERERKDELGDLASDVHTMYEKLKDAIAKLESEILRVREMEETQRYFFLAASHELKTPIAATSVLLEGMLENIGDYKDHSKYLRECIKLTDEQSKIIAEILEIVNLIDRKILPNLKPINLRDIILPILTVFETLTKAAGQQIHFKVSKNAVIMADKQMLSKVLSNVILNAIQNSPTGAAIYIWDKQTGDSLRLCVLNTNTHIDEEILPKLFDPFYKADKARSRKDKRSGLGLTIVQKALMAMDLDFSFENTDEGVLFWIDFENNK